MSCSIARYPVHLIDVLPVDNGSRVVIRPTLPQDAQLQRDFFRSLSPASRYRRFMTQINDVPDALIDSFTRADHTHHLALLAEMFDDEREIMIGEARYVVDAEDAATCEFAIAVADAWQGNGVGRTLLDRLERQAAASGVRRMLAETLIVNRRMIGLAQQAGYTVMASCKDPRVATLEKWLSSATLASAYRQGPHS